MTCHTSDSLPWHACDLAAAPESVTWPANACGKLSRAGKVTARILLLLLVFATCAEVRSNPSSSHGSQTDGLTISLESTETSVKVELTMHDANVRVFMVTLQEDTFITEITYIESDSPSKADFFYLVPCLDYTVSIQPLDADWKKIGNSKSQSISTQIATPPPVTELFSQNSAEGFTLTWQRPDTECEITAYNITYSGVAKWGSRTRHRGSETIGREDANDATLVNIDSLQPYTDYTMTVTASTDKGVGELTFINTQTEEAAPTKPTNLQMFKSTASTVSLIWKEPNELRGELKDYHVSCYDGITRLFTETTHHPVHIISGLSACTEYTVEVAASTAGGRGDPATMAVRTRALPPPPVIGLVLRDHTLTWKRPATACEITAYKITYSAVAMSGPRTKAQKRSVNIGRGKANDATSIVIDDLQPNTVYILMVTASTEAGEGKTQRFKLAFALAGGVPKKAAPQKSDVATLKESNSIWPSSNTALAHVADSSATLVVSVIVSVHVALCSHLLHGRHVLQAYG